MKHIHILGTITPFMTLILSLLSPLFKNDNQIQESFIASKHIDEDMDPHSFQALVTVIGMYTSLVYIHVQEGFNQHHMCFNQFL